MGMATDGLYWWLVECHFNGTWTEVARHRTEGMARRASLSWEEGGGFKVRVVRGPARTRYYPVVPEGTRGFD